MDAKDGWKVSAIIEKIWHFDWLSAFIAAPFAVVLAWFVTAVIDRQPPVVYESARSKSESVPQGGTLEVEFTVFRHRVCPVTAKRWLTDSHGERHAIPSYTVGPRVQLAGLDTYRRTITIPEAAALGHAEYQVDLLYACNLIHRLGWPIEIQSPEIAFEITPRPLILLPPLQSIFPQSDDSD